MSFYVMTLNSMTLLIYTSSIDDSEISYSMNWRKSKWLFARNCLWFIRFRAKTLYGIWTVNNMVTPLMIPLHDFKKI